MKSAFRMFIVALTVLAFSAGFAAEKATEKKDEKAVVKTAEK